MKPSPRIALLALIAVALGVCAVLLVQRETSLPTSMVPSPDGTEGPTTPASSVMPIASPSPLEPADARIIDRALSRQAASGMNKLQWRRTFERIEADIQKLRGESLEESLVNLSQVGMFYWPGFMSEDFISLALPLGKSVGWEDPERIFSNRRFLKLYAELGDRNPQESARLVSNHLEAAMSDYRAMFTAFALEWRGRYIITDDSAPRTSDTSPPYQIDDNPDESPTLLGLRYKVLTLVFLAGSLELKPARDTVVKVVEEAKTQREELYRMNDVRMTYAFGLLRDSALYQRQILGVGLLGTASSSDVARQALREAGAQWTETRRPLTAYDAETTPYDLISHMGMYPVDYSKGSRTVRYLEPLDDSQFDRLVEALGDR